MRTKRMILFLAIVLAITSSPSPLMAADTPAKIPSDTLYLGRSGSSANKSYVFDFGLGASNPSLFSDNATKALNYTKNIFNVGDGVSSIKQLVANTGAGASNPKIQYNPSTNSWEFANDGINFTAIGSGSGGAAVEMLTNQGFESGVSQGWSNTGGTFSAVTGGSNLLVGRGSASFTASATGQFFVSNQVTVPNGLVGGNCAASLLYKGGDGSQSFEVINGSSVVLAGPVVLPAVSVATTVPLTFPCPASGTMAVKVISSSSGALYAYDQMHLGSSDLINISQARLVGTISFSGCSGGGWTTSSTTLATFPVSTGCSYVATGALSAPATQIPGFSVASLPAGEYVVQLEGTGVGSGPSGASSFFQFTDGTVAAREVSEIGTADTMNASGFSQSMSYATAQSNLTIQVFGKSNTGSATVFSPSTIRMYYFPSQSQLATKVDSSAVSWSGAHGSNCTWTTASTSYADPAVDTSCTFTEVTNKNFGTVTSYNDGTTGHNLPGIVFTPSSVGSFYVCADARIEPDTAGQGADAELSDLVPVKVAASGTRTPAGVGSPVIQTTPVCGIYNAVSTSPITLRLRLKVDGSGNALIDSNGQDDAISWSIIKINQNFPAPILTGSVTSSSAGVLRTEMGHFAGGTDTSNCTSDPCTVYRATPAVTAVHWNSTGDYSIDFSASTFSQAPVCTFTCSVSTNGLGTYIGTHSSTVYETATIDSNTGVQADSYCDFLCTGLH